MGKGSTAYALGVLVVVDANSDDSIAPPTGSARPPGPLLSPQAVFRKKLRVTYELNLERVRT